MVGRDALFRDSCLPYKLDLRNDIIFVNSRNLSKLTCMLKDAYMIGIDTETRPSFFNRKTKFGRYPTSIIQIAVRNKAESEFVAIVDLLQLSTDGNSMIDFNNIMLKSMTSAETVKIGQGLENDLREICTSYPTLTSFRDVHSIMDTNVLYRHLYPEIKQDVSLKNLALTYLHCELIKTQQCSDWARRPLSPSQIDYAAGDALILLRLFDAMTCEAADSSSFNLSSLLRRYQYGVSNKRAVKPATIEIPPTTDLSCSPKQPLNRIHTRFEEVPANIKLPECLPESNLDTMDEDFVIHSNCSAAESDDQKAHKDRSIKETKIFKRSKERDIVGLKSKRGTTKPSKRCKVKKSKIWKPIHNLMNRKSTECPFVKCSEYSMPSPALLS